MKKIINKNTIFGFIIGAIIFGTVGVLAENYLASQIKYNKNGQSTVEGALNDLYSKKDESIPKLLWTNSNPTSGFSAQTISLNLSDYKYVIIVIRTGIAIDEDSTPRSSIILPVTETYPQNTTSFSITAGTCERSARVNINGIEISNEFKCNINNTVIPYKIYGIKADLNIDIWDN